MATVLHGLNELGVVTCLVVAEGDLAICLLPLAHNARAGEEETVQRELHLLVLQMGEQLGELSTTLLPVLQLILWTTVIVFLAQLLTLAEYLQYALGPVVDTLLQLATELLVLGHVLDLVHHNATVEHVAAIGEDIVMIAHLLADTQSAAKGA